MKNIFTSIRIWMALIVLMTVVASVAIAGSVYDRAFATIGTATGTGSWTNPYDYSAVALKRIWIQNCAIAVDTVTVSRVTSDLTYTQTVGTVVTASNAGSQSTLTAAYLKKGDFLTFSSGNTTGSTAMIEFEVQKH